MYKTTWLPSLVASETVTSVTTITHGAQNKAECRVPWQVVTGVPVVCLSKEKLNECLSYKTTVTSQWRWAEIWFICLLNERKCLVSKLLYKVIIFTVPAGLTPCSTVGVFMNGLDADSTAPCRLVQSYDPNPNFQKSETNGNNRTLRKDHDKQTICTLQVCNYAEW